MTPRTRHARGFSLIELLCSMAIGSIVLLAAASLLGISGESYERAGGGMAVERDARALISQLTSDLSTARFHKDGIFEKSSAAWPVDRIGFLSLRAAQAQTDAGRIGDLCAVNYYIKDLTLGGKTVRCLMRGFRESAETFKSLEGGTVSPLFTDRSRLDEPIAFGVVSFEARPKSREPSGKWIDWVKNDTTGPEALELHLVIARRRLAGKLRSPGDWDGAGKTAKLLGQASDAANNKDLEAYGILIPMGHDNNP